mmetsp:Transcript_116628/g.341362  ORF Transcript_116628/g.341362 Transcript_116628/m.341362 type:complete len:919 (-) Transcript_116628:50-2806(-)
MLSLKDGVAPVRAVGGKAASLMKLYSTPGISAHVPGGFALSVDFFSPWVERVVAMPAWSAAAPLLCSKEAPSACAELKEIARGLPLSKEQAQVLQALCASVRSWPDQLAAVRSSCPEEDGAASSFAGVFETKLGVTPNTLETMVRECFASVFDHRVFSYAGAHKPAFAAVVMEMVDSSTAGVAFSANPLNSDLDEMLVDSSWGLGESVVDGSVVADRFLWDKVRESLIEKTVGSKKQERRLRKDGGVDIKSVDEGRQAACTLSEAQVAQLAKLVCLVEKTYGMPMDTEWAYTEGDELRLLQARPITTLHPIDERMLTLPGQRRVLYYDFNVASEATTTSPFMPMDIYPYNQLMGISFGMPDLAVPTDPDQLMFVGATRYYFNLSHVMKLCGTERFANDFELVDPYLANIFRSDDCCRSKYRSKRFLPNDTSCCDTFRFLNRLRPFMCQLLRKKKPFVSDAAKAREERDRIYQACLANLIALEKRGAAEGAQRYFGELMDACTPVFMEDVAAILGVILPLFNSLNKARLAGKTEQERAEAGILLGGYEGDPLMEANIAMYQLAHKLPTAVWSAYKGRLSDLATRIAANLTGQISDLPVEFLEAWRGFMLNFGWDGADQLFVSSMRYVESPEMLLAKLQHNVGESVPDPEMVAKEKYRQRQELMAQQEAASSGCFAMITGRRKKVRTRNAALEHIMCLRNSPKLLMARVYAAFRAEMLKIQDRLLAHGRLDQRGDIFMLLPDEVDKALRDPTFDARAAVQPRQDLYSRAKQAKSCPMLIDSRGRILKPNVVKGEPGTLVGAAVSPGVGTGYVRVVTSPDGSMEEGEVLVAIVTDPAWTPLFAGASAIVLQVGGALQHGALCAREYGKPAVSGIDVMAELKTGMLVTVDGNTGVVKILEDGPRKRPSRHLSSRELDRIMPP